MLVAGLTRSEHASSSLVWAARGLYKTHSEQNSIVSMQRAFVADALGVEIDLYYDVKMDRFIISHDKPVKDKDDYSVTPPRPPSGQRASRPRDPRSSARP